MGWVPGWGAYKRQHGLHMRGNQLMFLSLSFSLLSSLSLEKKTPLKWLYGYNPTSISLHLFSADFDVINLGKLSHSRLRILILATRTDRKSMARKSDTKEIKNKHSSRPVGGAEMGSRGGEDSHGSGGTETGRVWDERGRQSDH